MGAQAGARASKKHTSTTCHKGVGKPSLAPLPHAQVSDEAERSVLVKLKTECGYQFTSKLESMFTDIKTSRDTMQEYKARRQASANGEDDVELAVQVPAPALPSPHRMSAHT